MERLLSLVSFNDDPKLGGADSFSDRLSCRYTVVLLTSLGFGITAFQWLGSTPIFCWCPPHFTGSMLAYTNAYCWSQNTYYVPFNSDVLPKHTSDKRYLIYYQWVGLMLCFQAIIFFLPRVLWQNLSKMSGIAITSITDAALDYQKAATEDESAKILQYLTNRFCRFLFEMERIRHKNTPRYVVFNCFGCFLPLAYLFVKSVYLLNALFQIWILEKFLAVKGTYDHEVYNYHIYGLHILLRAYRGESLTVTERFPKVTLCDVQVRELGNIHNYTIQCALPMNLFNEKIYMFVWFWVVFVLIVTAASWLKWTWVTLLMVRQDSYVLSRLESMHWVPNSFEHASELGGKKHRTIFRSKSTYEPNTGNVYKFVNNFLRRDGMFVLRMVSKNTSDVIAADLMYQTWLSYMTFLPEKRALKDNKKNCRFTKKIDQKPIFRRAFSLRYRQPSHVSLGTLRSVHELDGDYCEEDHEHENCVNNKLI